MGLLATPPAASAETGGEAAWKVTEPPGEWRTVTIDTTETTWSNVDVSPDGKTLSSNYEGIDILLNAPADAA